MAALSSFSWQREPGVLKFLTNHGLLSGIWSDGTVKVDLKRDIASYHAPPRGEFRVVEVPPLHYLTVEGSGDPNVASEYREALETLYPVAYSLKFFSKRQLDRDYTVMPLEALWWADDPAAFTSRRDKSSWHWRAMILTPEWLTAEHVDVAIDAVRAKGVAPALDALQLAALDEGLCVQTLHVGSYDDEGPILERMHTEFIPGQGLAMTGIHHEIYFSDARRTAPEKLRTMLRQPVRPA